MDSADKKEKKKKKSIFFFPFFVTRAKLKSIADFLHLHLNCQTSAPIAK